MNPEEQARLDIDKMLTDSGWIIQDYEDRNLSSSLSFFSLDERTEFAIIFCLCCPAT